MRYLKAAILAISLLFMFEPAAIAATACVAPSFSIVEPEAKMLAQGVTVVYDLKAGTPAFETAKAKLEARYGVAPFQYDEIKVYRAPGQSENIKFMVTFINKGCVVHYTNPPVEKDAIDMLFNAGI